MVTPPVRRGGRRPTPEPESPSTGTATVEGLLAARARVELRPESERLVVFGDGIESDTITLAWGQRLSVGVADRRLCLL